MPDVLPLGSTEPRIWTRPLVELTPETSYGFGVIEFARDVLHEPLDPWQQWAVIHLGELLPDGRPRFRTVLLIVARQQGKTHLLRTLTLYWLFVQRLALVLGTSTNLDYAREAWEAAVAAAEANEALSALIAPNGVRRANGEQRMDTVDRCRYKIAASNRKGGRSLTVHRLVIDELREHYDWSAWNAATPATNAVPGAQIVCLSNMGDDRSVVLDDLRASAVEFLETGVGDHRLGILEWSSPEGAEVDDVHALAAANPNVGRRTDWDTLLGPAKRAKAAGGDQEAGFRTESMCQRVRSLDAAVDPRRWDEACLDGDLSAVRGRVVLFLDVSPDELHVTLVAAARLDDERVRVEVVKAWAGADATGEMRAQLPALVGKVRARALGWLPGGPAASVGAFLRTVRLGCPVQELSTDAASVCMGFAEQVRNGDVVHAGDPLLDAHVKGAEKYRTGDRWTFSRRGGGHCDGAYAAAGAVHLARTLRGGGGLNKVIYVEG